MSRFAGKVAVITGGAAGLGEAMARLLVAEGGKVVIADVSAPRAAALAGELGGGACAVTCDVTDEEQVAAAIDSATEHFGRLDLVVANAGIVGVMGPIADTPMDDYDRTMAILLRGAFVTVKHAARALIAQGQGGAIVCTASTAGLQGGLGPHVYTVAKSGVIGLTRAAAAELRQHGIRVNAVAPTGIPTRMTAHIMLGDPDRIDEVAEALGRRAPLGRVPTAADIAEAVLYLGSDAGSYVTGQVLAVDGGLTTTGTALNFAAATRMVDANEST
ncbi:MAG TPA: glucose 1-dehydrogenase [Acidimicrobiales bacterium]